MTDVMTTVAPHTTEALQELAALLPGQVAVPGDPGWDELRLGWVRSVDQRPRAIVTVHEDEDVVAAVTWAARHRSRSRPKRSGTEPPPPSTAPSCSGPGPCPTSPSTSPVVQRGSARASPGAS
jgi:hypothetical protein